ncbi:TonB-dependent receptor [Winogradskyella sp. J14-2]|uniref:TonB-dependent receptor n=1 Tax=Winogradskyella sp. J14-2 TaxID=1936080 RepID=UPI000972BFC7|nr:TonB-dependent receptor [Winogradskyella sp. J14-2]APY08574.1 TonB-dependent receptor [Winogradskyella sp. J14-2]
MLRQIIIVLLISLQILFAQKKEVLLTGTVTSNNNPVAYASVYVKNSSTGTITDNNGNYQLSVNPGTIVLTVRSQGFQTLQRTFTLKDNETRTINFELEEDALGLDQVVVSATRNKIGKKEAPVIVKVLTPKVFNAAQSFTLADGLNFQPGVRMETNCQNCGFTQVRMNGLEGQYTQILVNSRPVFSALNGVYGLEQIPVNIIDRVEVVRSGGSALFGSNAIAGTINVITKEPMDNHWEINSTLALIDGNTADRNVNLNASIVSDDLSNGVTLYGIYRNRDAYDANNDGFTEITVLENNSFGAKAFLRPNDNSRIGFDFTAIKEYRRGGDQLHLAPQFTNITEALDHNTIFSGLDYELYNDKRTNNLSVYASVQHTNRDSYYGGLGGGTTPEDFELANNAFGNTKDLAFVSGAKFSHDFENNDVLTTGLEYLMNATNDEILGYNKVIDQRVNSFALYGQYEWKPFKAFTALLGARLDHVTVDGLYSIQNISRTSKVSQSILSPRVTLLYNITDQLQLRGGYARGFRAPQAFNEDLHISSVGGEQRFVILGEGLKNEFSNAYTASLDYTKSFGKTQTNLLIEGFYTSLQNPFTIVSTGTSLPNGSILEETRNGNGAYVSGANIEFSVVPSPTLAFQAGLTVQNANYKEDQILFEADGTVPNETDVVIDAFVRTPNVYGFITSYWNVNNALKLDFTGNYTGPMTVPFVISESGFINLIETNSFFDLTTKLTYHFDLKKEFHIEISGGVQNIFNSYQDDFDTGPTRDSDFIYGPNRPRTFFFGLKIGNF